jgi:hypothetical protein
MISARALTNITDLLVWWAKTVTIRKGTAEKALAELELYEKPCLPFSTCFAKTPRPGIEPGSLA